MAAIRTAFTPVMQTALVTAIRARPASSLSRRSPSRWGQSQFHSSPFPCRSKRSFASEPAPDAPDEVPVMRTRGKGPKGASSTTKGARSKHGQVEEARKQDPSRYETTTTNAELPGERFEEGSLKENMERAVKRCRETVTRMVGSHGRADPAVLDSVRVTLPSPDPPSAPTKSRLEAGESFNIKEFATIGVRDGALIVTCFDPSTVKHVERAIYAADLDLSPQHVTDGEEGVLRIPVPRPTAETRERLAKEVNKVCENARISIRTARHHAQKQIRSDEKRRVIGKDEGMLEMKRMEDETKRRTAEVDSIQEDTRARLERG